MSVKIFLLCVAALVCASSSDVRYYEGDVSCTSDDCKSTVSCLAGEYAISCDCNGDACEGAYFVESTDDYTLDDVVSPDAEYNAGVCVGHRSNAAGDGVTATIGCMEGKVETATVANEPEGDCDSRDGLTNSCVGQLTATCPAGYTATDCNCVSYWTACDSVDMPLEGNSCTFESSGQAVAQVHCTQDEVEDSEEDGTEVSVSEETTDAEEAEAEYNCDPALVGDDWWLVRRTTAKTHPATDQLNGTEVYGEYGKGTFSVNFEDTVPGYNQILFTTGSCNHWMIMNKESAIGGYYDDELRLVERSHIKLSPYEVYAYRREDKAEDPWIQYGIEHDQATALYEENNYDANAGGDSEGSLYDGLNVYVRNNATNVDSSIVNSSTTDADASEFAVCAGHAPDNGLCNYTCLSGDLYDYDELFIPFDTTGATVEDGEVGEGSISNTVWFEFYNDKDYDFATVSIELDQAGDDDIVLAIYEGTKKVHKVCADINAPRFDYLELIAEGAALSGVPLNSKKHYYIQVDGAETCGLLKASATYNV